MVLYELMTRRYPFDGMNAMQLGLKVALENLQPDIPAMTNPVLAEIMISCWSPDIFSRPTCQQILTKLDGL
jgi:hypothetical protein